MSLFKEDISRLFILSGGKEHFKNFKYIKYCKVCNSQFGTNDLLRNYCSRCYSKIKSGYAVKAVMETRKQFRRSVKNKT